MWRVKRFFFCVTDLFCRILKSVCDKAKVLLSVLTLFSTLTCIFLFMQSFFNREPMYAIISLVAMLTFVYVNLKS